MPNELQLEEIKKEIEKVKSKRYYYVISIVLSILGCCLLIYGFLSSFNFVLISIGGIWIVVAAGILVNGIMANHYKMIIENLIERIEQLSLIA